MKKNKRPFVSVIIPTFNRCEILEMCLRAYDKQFYRNFEIIVVDDGSTDKTREQAIILQKTLKKLKIKYFYQRKKGPAAARNLGIHNSSGEIILIVNDDTIPSEDLIKEHVLCHLKYPEDNYGILGFFTWSPEIKITPFMKWLESKGPQFSYSKIKGERAEWYHFWTCNLSVKKNFLLNFGLFDESFPYAAWEDIELGYRLGKHGLKLVYNKNAVGYHYHPTSLISTLERMKKHGHSIVILGKKIKDSLLPPLATPSIANKLDLIDRIFFIKPIESFFIKVASFAEKRMDFGIIYDLLLLHFRIKGRREFLNQNAK